MGIVPEPQKGSIKRPLGPPDAQEDQGRRQGFLQRRLAGQRPVAPLVQPGAAGVDGQHGLVVEQGHFQGVFGARLHEPLDPIGGLEPLDDRLLDDFLAGRHAGKLRLDRPARHGELGLDGKPVFPGQGPRCDRKAGRNRGLRRCPTAPGRGRPSAARGSCGRYRTRRRQTAPAGLDDFRFVAQPTGVPARRRPPVRRCWWRSDRAWRSGGVVMPYIVTSPRTGNGSSESVPFRMAEPTRTNLTRTGGTRTARHPAMRGIGSDRSRFADGGTDPADNAGILIPAASTRRAGHLRHARRATRGATACRAPRRRTTRGTTGFARRSAGRGGLHPAPRMQTRLAADRRRQQNQNCRHSEQPTHDSLPFSRLSDAELRYGTDSTDWPLCRVSSTWKLYPKIDDVQLPRSRFLETWGIVFFHHGA